MARTDNTQAVLKHVTKDAHLSAFCIIDGASAGGLLQALYKYQPEQVCLYRGKLEPDLAETAPYLVRLDPESDFAEWMLEKGWGRHWGIFALAERDLHAMRAHFRRFLMVHDESGRSLYFRYYDPRVLRVYLPTCNAEELRTLFGPVERYCLEDEDPATLLEFGFVKDKLSRREVKLAKASA